MVIFPLIKSSNQTNYQPEFSYVILPFQSYYIGNSVSWGFDQSKAFYYYYQNKPQLVAQQSPTVGISQNNCKLSRHQQQSNFEIYTENKHNQTSPIIPKQKQYPQKPHTQVQPTHVQTLPHLIQDKCDQIQNYQKKYLSQSIKISSQLYHQNIQQNLSKTPLKSGRNKKKIKKGVKKSKKQNKQIVEQKIEKEVGHWKRTILPNIYHIIFAFLIRKQKSQSFVKRLFQKIGKPNKKLNDNYSIGRYYQYQLLLKEKLVYCNNQDKFSLLKQIHDPHCSNYRLEEQMYYNKISRVVLQHFVNQQLLLQLLHKQKSKKLNQNEADQFHLKQLEMLRQIKKLLINTYRI